MEYIRQFMYQIRSDHKKDVQSLEQAPQGNGHSANLLEFKKPMHNILRQQDLIFAQSCLEAGVALFSPFQVGIFCDSEFHVNFLKLTSSNRCKCSILMLSLFSIGQSNIELYFFPTQFEVLYSTKLTIEKLSRQQLNKALYISHQFLSNANKYSLGFTYSSCLLICACL